MKCALLKWQESLARAITSAFWEHAYAEPFVLNGCNRQIKTFDCSRAVLTIDENVPRSDKEDSKKWNPLHFLLTDANCARWQNPPIKSKVHHALMITDNDAGLL